MRGLRYPKPAKDTSEPGKYSTEKARHPATQMLGLGLELGWLDLEGKLEAMALRSPVLFAGAFLVLATAYLTYFNIALRVDPSAAENRFTYLMEAQAPRRAAPHGERAIALQGDNGATNNDLAPLKTNVARAQIDSKNYARGVTLLGEALSSKWARDQEIYERIDLEDEYARALILSGSLERAVAIYSSFLELAGDAASRGGPLRIPSLNNYYADRVGDARPLFAQALNHAGSYESEARGRESKLAVAQQMASLGAFYSMRDDGAHAAAGLLSAAYQIRKVELGGDHQETVQLTLVLGPVYAEMGRLDAAEDLYLDAFHAQEEAKGSNSPDLSLYIKLLAGIYEKQGRMTEAQALYEHMRGLFRDAFGAQRYAVNRERDRKSDVNRPVSQYFLLEPEYAPSDLVSAVEFSIPTSKAPSIDEMKLRLAPDQDSDAREANMPVRLAQLISLCRSESGEEISLRSGYRSFQTQFYLHQRNGNRGTVTPAGMSEHQTGLSVDINVNNRFMRPTDRSYQCFKENAFRFGFILSYPPGNDYLPGADTFEPWHWRYVGVQTAHLYREAGPHHKPQEFLAALPCYQERASKGYFPTAGEPDICLAQPTLNTAAANTDEEDQPHGESSAAARILNDAGSGKGGARQ